MEWFNHPPTEPGWHLRSNPPIQAIVKEHVVELDGKLFVSGAPDGISLMPVKNLHPRFWWFGPIPEPPWKAELKKGK